MNRRMKARSLQGVTLVELLIVMSIIVLLATLTLPSFRSMLQDQKVTQATRMVQTMIESAKSRAIANGRPVSVIFERITTDPTATPSFNLIPDNTSTRISLGEVFPPYEGDWAGATGDLADMVGSDGVPDTLNIELAKVASLYDATASTFTGMVDEGDLLQLGDHSQLFTITGLGKTGNVVHISFANPPVGFPVTDALWFGNTADLRFRMIRRPTKSLSGSTELPRGMCVDLSHSGYGTSGDQFAVPARTPPTFPDVYGPLMVVFNARGTLDGAYYISHTSTGYAMTMLTAPGVCHLLVGRVEQVEPTGTVFGSDRDRFKPNLYDEANFWISINPYNGSIYSSPNATGSPSGTPAVDRQNARVHAIQVLPGERT